MKSVYLVLLVMIFTLVGCQELKDLQGSYNVVEVDGRNMMDQGITITVEVDEDSNRISGNNGCNQYGGSFQVNDEGSIELSQMMATKMYCPEKADIETKFMTQLNNVKKAKLNKDILVLRDMEDNVVIKAKKINE